MTTLVVGSMSPDFPLFVHWSRGYALSHSLLGSATVDLAVTLTVVWLWFTLFRDSMIELAPEAVRSRLPRHVTLTPREWLLSVPAAWAGALTHVIWDSFTHSGRWGADRLAWLRLEYAGLPRYEWAQYASTLIGFAIVCLAAILFLRKLPPIQELKQRPPWVPVLLPIAFLIGTVMGLVTVSGNSSPISLSVAFSYTLNVTIAVFWCVTGLCLVWRIFLRKPAMRSNVLSAAPLMRSEWCIPFNACSNFVSYGREVHGRQP